MAKSSSSTLMDKKSPSSGKKNASVIQNALDEIEKQYGKGAIMKMGDTELIEIERFSSGALSLDLALGGGVPKGRIIEIFGPESSGKTTLALHMVSEIQKLGGQAAFIDAEHALDPLYAKRIGVDIDNLLISQPDDGESALEITETLVRSGGVDLIVIDSVAALTPRAEIEGMMGDSHMGLQARLMSQALRKLTAIVSKTSCSVIFINQIRMKIGVMFGNPETTTGGNALKFYSSLRLDVRRIDKIAAKKSADSPSDTQEIIGNRVRVKVVKNKVAPPFRQAEFDVIYNRGINREGDLIDLGVRDNILTKSGAFFSYEGNKLGQGRDQAVMFLVEHPEIAKALEAEIRVKAAL
ncbi:MAG TPA: recombinase RecA [Candidatus Peribacterales bacterium]|nr:recombinase RecA [Candidatus Peribacterales bacterium]